MYTHDFLGFVLACVIAAGGTIAMTAPADAARRTACMTDHFHYGSSTGRRTKKVAEREAIQSWADFTAFEYGAAWASFRKARSTAVRCSQDPSGWSCSVEGVPCR